MLGEELVVGGDHAAAERAAGEVGQAGEVGHRAPRDGGGLTLACRGASSRPIGAPSAGCPRSQVRRTTPVSSRPGVRRDRVAVLEVADGPPLLGRERDQVGVPADRDRALARQAGQPGRRLGHPADHVGPARCPARRAPVQTAGQRHLQRGDAAPGRAEVADVEPLEVRGARRVVADDEVDVAVAQRRPQRLAVRRLADRRAALERRRAVGHLLGGEGQVVRAGLDGDPHALGAGLPQHRQRVGVGQVDDVRPRPRVAGGRDQPADRRLLRRARAGTRGSRRSSAPSGSGAAAMTSASSACAMSRPSKVGELGERGPQAGVVQRRELRDAGVEQEALEADDARLVQRAQLVEVARHGAAPEGDVDRDLALRRLAFHVQRLDGGRRRDRVEGHVDDRGDPAGDRGAGRGGEALPLGAPRLVDVHVAVDQPGQQHLVVGQGDRGRPGRRRTR